MTKVIVVPARRGNRRPLFAKRGLVKPRCSRARLRLKVRAHDNLSHVRSVTYRFGRRGTPTVLNFSSNVPVKVPPKLRVSTRLFVAVQDGALNLSKQHKVSLRRVCR